MNEKIIINYYNNLDLKIAFWHKRSEPNLPDFGPT